MISVLGNLRDNLVNSDDFVMRNVASLQGLSGTQKIDFEKYVTLVTDSLKGEEIFRRVLDYYRKSVPYESFATVVDLFDASDVQKLQEKEKLDLNPETYGAFQRKLPSISNWSKKVPIIESFDELARTSDSSIWVADLITKSMIESYSILTGDKRLMVRLEKSSDDNLGTFDLQTRYATSEALRYTYQDFELEELEKWKTFLSNEDLQLILGHLKPALEYAYGESVTLIRNKINILAKK